MEIPARLVKELRDRTNAGFNDCRAALVEAAGDIEKEAGRSKVVGRS